MDNYYRLFEEFQEFDQYIQGIKPIRSGNSLDLHRWEGFISVGAYKIKVRILIPEEYPYEPPEIYILNKKLWNSPMLGIDKRGKIDISRFISWSAEIKLWQIVQNLIIYLNKKRVDDLLSEVKQQSETFFSSLKEIISNPQKIENIRKKLESFKPEMFLDKMRSKETLIQSLLEILQQYSENKGQSLTPEQVFVIILKKILGKEDSLESKTEKDEVSRALLAYVGSNAVLLTKALDELIDMLEIGQSTSRVSWVIKLITDIDFRLGALPIGSEYRTKFRNMLRRWKNKLNSYKGDFLKEQDINELLKDIKWIDSRIRLILEGTLRKNIHKRDERTIKNSLD